MNQVQRAKRRQKMMVPIRSFMVVPEGVVCFEFEDWGDAKLHLFDGLACSWLAYMY